MDSSESPGRRARPARPDVRLEPLREEIPDARPRLVDLSLGLWILALVSLAATAVFVATDLTSIRDSLTQTLTSERPETDAADIGSAVDITLLGSGVAALLVLLLALMGMNQIRRRTAVGRTVLAVVALAAAAGSIAFWTVVSGSVGGALAILPWVVAALAIVGSAVLFAPLVGRWLAGTGRLLPR